MAHLSNAGTARDLVIAKQATGCEKDFDSARLGERLQKTELEPPRRNLIEGRLAAIASMNK